MEITKRKKFIASTRWLSVVALTLGAIGTTDKIAHADTGDITEGTQIEITQSEYNSPNNEILKKKIAKQSSVDSMEQTSTGEPVSSTSTSKASRATNPTPDKVETTARVKSTVPNKLKKGQEITPNLGKSPQKISKTSVPTESLVRRKSLPTMPANGYKMEQIKPVATPLVRSVQSVHTVGSSAISRTSKTAKNDKRLLITPKSGEQIQKIQDTTLKLGIDELLPDKNLQQLVLYALQQQKLAVTTPTDITQDMLKKLTKLDVDDKTGSNKQKKDQNFYNAVNGVQSLAGLKYATNLTRLVITRDTHTGWGRASGNLQNISDIQALSNLTFVNFDRNKIKNTKDFANLKALTNLSLSHNQINDLSGIANLTNLTTINFDANKISDISALTKLVNLQVISLSKNDITDISALKGITAIPKNMNLGYNHIYDITPVLSLSWQPFFGPDPYYVISAGNQTLVLDQAILNPTTKTLSTWSFAYDNLTNFNEVMDGYPKRDTQPANDLSHSDGRYNTIGNSRWITWYDLTGGSLNLNWHVARGDSYEQQQLAAPNGLTFNGTIEIPYTLRDDMGSVTVNFKLDDGVNIAPFQILSGAVNSQFDVLNPATVQATISELNRRGFIYEYPRKSSLDLSTVTKESMGTYGTDSQNVALVFTLGQRIHFVDEQGTTIQDDVVKTGAAGTTWTTTIPELKGYTYDRVEGSTPTAQTLSGKFVEYSPDINIIYKADQKPVVPVKPGQPNPPVTPETPSTTGTVTVHYQTTTGQELASQILTGTVGQPYATMARTFTGYQLDRVPANTSGTYTATNQNVVYVYTVNVATPKPVPVPTPEQPAANNNGDQIATDDLAPQTGKITAVITGAAVQSTNGPQVARVAPSSSLKYKGSEPAQLTKASLQQATIGGSENKITKSVLQRSAVNGSRKVAVKSGLLPQTNSQPKKSWLGCWLGWLLLVLSGGIVGLKRKHD
ncbi:MucBP domain-containing protein [Levilactobacillus suantsaii]|uniref:MucBP domain-containing protein n=1 Tax=Levilactobacillus suantsaii TaxID=2292255 RepID=UPI0015F505F9|nr:MucBP domain-containing protein [Levilactobacillus suantsaii]QMU08784.1 MucBP domain-containing protein [Levilactobacillus suantsaii]